MTNRERAEEAHNLVSIHSNTELRIGAIEAALDAACQEERERCAVKVEKWAWDMSSCTIDELIAAIRQSGAKDE